MQFIISTTNLLKGLHQPHVTFFRKRQVDIVQDHLNTIIVYLFPNRLQPTISNQRLISTIWLIEGLQRATKLYDEKFHGSLKLEADAGWTTVMHLKFIQLFDTTFNSDIRKTNAIESTRKVSKFCRRRTYHTTQGQELIVRLTKTLLKLGYASSITA